MLQSKFSYDAFESKPLLRHLDSQLAMHLPR